MFTIALAGVAIFTAVRLYQQRGQSVAPTAPTSIPRAAEPNTTSCNPVTFSLASAPKCGDACSADTDCPTDHTCSTTTNKCVLTACLATGATCDAAQCNEVTPANPNCGDTCSTNSDCPTDHTCSTTTNKCVLTLCTQSGRTCDSSKCTLTPKCGDTCTTNSQCPTDHTCTSGKCVLNDCLQSGKTCTADNCTVTTPSSTTTPTTAPSLPQAGTGYPTVIAGTLGILAIIGALFLAF